MILPNQLQFKEKLFHYDKIPKDLVTLIQTLNEWEEEAAQKGHDIFRYWNGIVGRRGWYLGL